MQNLSLISVARDADIPKPLAKSPMDPFEI
jgi:hypothetical protein